MTNDSQLVIFLSTCEVNIFVLPSSFAVVVASIASSGSKSFVFQRRLLPCFALPPAALIGSLVSN